MNHSMRACQATSYGTAADSLRLASIARPEPGRGEIRLRVQAASLNPIDFKLLRGDLHRIWPLSFPVTMGFDVSGVVDALGAEVTRFALGDRVFVRASRQTLGAFSRRSITS